jgi:hypothetical protein
MALKMRFIMDAEEVVTAAALKLEGTLACL